MDIKEQTRNVAAQGRYGDSMLLHVNPAEVRGLSQALPITVNPQTGQPEAFLPFIAPFVGSYLGKAALGKAIGMAAAGAIGGGLAQYAVTGDLKEGLLAGLSSFGVNKGIDELGKLGAQQATAAVTADATDQATKFAAKDITKDIDLTKAVAAPIVLLLLLLSYHKILLTDLQSYQNQHNLNLIKQWAHLIYKPL